MSEPKRHHFIPQFYLRQWAALDGSVIRYHRPREVVVAGPISPKSTGYEEALYALEGLGDDRRNDIETKFLAAEVDTPAADALRQICDRNKPKLTVETRLAWARFLTSIHVRHPERVKDITEQAKASLRETFSENPEEYEALRQDGDPATLLEYVELNVPHVLENHGLAMLPGIIQHEPTIRRIMGMRWVVVRFDAAVPDLLTSDRPLILTHGIQDEKCVLALPISPTEVFLASRDLEALAALHSRAREGTLLRHVNESVLGQAVRNVYGAHAGLKGLTERFLGRSPPPPAKPSAHP